MAILILAAIALIGAVYLVASTLRQQRRPLAEAISTVEQYLRKPRHDTGRYEVELGQARPLSEHMVKDIAKARGLRFTGQGVRHSNTTLEFAPAAERAEDADR